VADALSQPAPCPIIGGPLDGGETTPVEEWFQVEMPVPLAGFYEDPMGMIADHNLYDAGRILTWYRLVMLECPGRKSRPAFLHEGTDESVLETFDRRVLPLPNRPKPGG
jgi:hypothetical protein